MLAVLVVAFSVGLDNLGAATAIGVSGVDRHLRFRIAVVFGAFEAAMPVVGLVLGSTVSRHLGSNSKVLAGTVLCLVGASALLGAVRAGGDEGLNTNYSTSRLLLLGAALSIDNVAVGFALGTYRVGIIVAALIIGLISITMSLIGLELGARLGDRLGERSEYVGGAVLILIGILIATGVL